MSPLPPFFKGLKYISLGSSGLRRYGVRNEASKTCEEVP